MAFLQCMRSYGCADSSSILVKEYILMWCNFHKTKLIQYDLASISQSLSTEHARPCNRQSCNSGVRVRMRPVSPLPLDFFAAYRWRGVGREAANKKKREMMYVSLHSNWTMAGFGVVARSTQSQSVRQAAGIRESVRTPVPLILALQWHDALFRLLFEVVQKLFLNPIFLLFFLEECMQQYLELTTTLCDSTFEPVDAPWQLLDQHSAVWGLNFPKIGSKFKLQQKAVSNCWRDPGLPDESSTD